MKSSKGLYTLLAMATCQVAWCQLQIQAVVNSASYLSYLPGAGGLASIFVSGLKGAPGLVSASTDSPLPSQLAGVQVFIDGVPAPILAVYIPESGSSLPGQVNFQVPFDWAIGVQNGNIEVEQFTSASPVPLTGMTAPQAIAAPAGGFFAGQNGLAIAQHASDYSLVTAQSPAQPGETIIVYGNDFFQVWPPPPIGFPTPSQPLFLPTTPYPGSTGYLFLAGPPVQNPGLDKGTCPPTGSLPVNVTFEGLAPGLVGVEQINFVVPANQQPGTFALYFNNATDSEGMCSPNGNSSPYVMIPVG